MMRKFCVAAVFVACSFGPSLAQEAPPPPPSADQQAPEMGPGRMPPPPHHGPRGERGPKPPMASFDIQAGEDNKLKVDCGDQPLTDCVAAVQPLIDRILPPAP